MTILNWLWQTTWQAALLAAVIGIIAFTFRRWLSPQARQLLWLLVFVRLVMPVLPGSPFSVFRMLGDTPPPVQPTLPSVLIVTQQIESPVIEIPVMKAPAAKPSQSHRIEYAIIAIWIAGVMLMIARVCFSTIRFMRMLARDASHPDARTLEIVASCANECRVHPPTVCVTDLVSTPAVCGIFKPKLLLPPVVLSRLDAADVRAVVLHELEHLRRHHLLIDSMLLAIRAVHWFNPAGWWAHRQIRAARELVCDQAAMRRLGRDRSTEYGHALLNVVALIDHPTNPAFSIGFFSDKGILRERVRSIAGFGNARYVAGLGIILAIALAAFFLTRPAPKAPALQESPQQTETKPDSAHEVNTEALALLDKRLPEVKFDNTPISGAIDRFRDVTGANIYVNWKALEEAGIKKDSPITARMKNVKFSKALSTVLDDLGGEKIRLGYTTADEGIITISTERDLSKNVIIRVYDIRDLILTIPDFIAPDFGTPGSKPQTVGPEPTRDQLVAGVIELVKDTIAADTWKDKGGEAGTIREVSGQLIVTQTPENQKRILDVLGALRQTRGIQITVESRFLRGDPVIKKATEFMDARKELSEGMCFLSDEETKDLVQSTQADKASTTISAPRITLFNAQRAYVKVAAQRAYIAALHPTTSPQGTVGVEPELGSAVSGVNLDCQATLNADRKAVLLTLRPQFSNLLALTPSTQPDQKDPVVQVPTVESVKCDESISVPLDKTLAMLLHPTISPPDAGNVPKPMLMLVKPTLIIQREVESKQFPLPAK